MDIHGKFTDDIGLYPRGHLPVALNGHLGPTADGKLCADGRCDIVQNNTTLHDGQIPTKGQVLLKYHTPVPYTELKKGNYTVRAELYTSEEVGKARMTAFEATVWIEGDGEGDGKGGWV